MRGTLLTFAFAALILSATASAAPGALSSGVGPVTVVSAVSAQSQLPDKPLDVDININRAPASSGVAWYRSPLWIAIGGLGVIVLLLIVVLAARGGGTTVIKE